MLKPRIVASEPPVHVGPVGIDWAEFRRRSDSFRITSTELSDGSMSASYTYARDFLARTDEDARAHFGVDDVQHNVMVRMGKEIPHSSVNIFLKSLGLEVEVPGAYHLDIAEQNEHHAVAYMSSNIMPTDHLLGRFLTFGRRGIFEGLVSAAAISFQARRGLWMRALPDEIVRVDLDSAIHRSPARRLHADGGEQHRFIHDWVAPCA